MTSNRTMRSAIGERNEPTDSALATPSGPTPAPLETRRIRLRPATPSDADFLHDIVFDDGLIPLGTTSESEPAHRSLVNFIICRTDTGSPIGSTGISNPHFANGYAYFGVRTLRDALRTGFGVEGAGLCINYAFQMWNFRKLYSETTDVGIRYFGSALGRLLKEEGRLRDHEFFAGTYWDRVTLAMYREDWYKIGLPLLTRAINGVQSSTPPQT